jgi:methyl-accepting chemotaxis protein
VRNLKLVYKMSVLIAVLLATMLGIAGAGLVNLRRVNERSQHLAAVTTRDRELCGDMRAQLLSVVRAQKNAVLAGSDEAARSFADLALKTSAEVERLRQELVARRGIEPAKRQPLDKITHSWEEYQKIQKTLLDLAVQNTNIKALKLCFGSGLDQLNTYATALDAIVRMIEKRITEPKIEPGAAAKLLRAAVLIETIKIEAFRFHLALAAMVNASAAELVQLEAQVEAEQKVRDGLVSELTKAIDERDQPLLERALSVRVDYQKVVADIRRLSKIDSNRRAADMSINQAFASVDDCDKQLTTLLGQLREEEQADVKISQEVTDSATWWMGAITLSGVLAGLLLSVWMVRSITGPLALSIGLVKAIAQGDLTQRMHLAQEDEIGQLAGAMDALSDRLASIMTEQQEKAQAISKSSEELDQVSKQLHSQSEHVAGQTTTVASGTEELSQSIQSMAASAEQMSMNINSISSASEEMSVNVARISAAAEQTSTNVKAVAQAVGDISGSLRQIAKDAQEGSQVASKATQMATNATATMNSLDHSAVEITKVTETIKMIALQTNLLALNATIEATSAGEAGKGFAVVANEIKELANQSGKAAEGITTKIEGIQASIRDAVKVIQTVAEVIGTINLTAGRISGAVEQQTEATHTISLNVKEASKGVGEIARSIAEVASGANDMSKNVSEAAVGANAVSKNASEAAKASNSIASSIHSVSAATQQTTASAGKVRVSAESLMSIGVRLRDIVSKFKTERHA